MSSIPIRLLGAGLPPGFNDVQAATARRLARGLRSGFIVVVDFDGEPLGWLSTPEGPGDPIVGHLAVTAIEELAKAVRTDDEWRPSPGQERELLALARSAVAGLAKAGRPVPICDRILRAQMALAVALVRGGERTGRN